MGDPGSTFLDCAESWSDLALRSLVDGSVAFLLVGAVWLLLRARVSARVGHALFAVLLVKLALPGALPAPQWLAWLAPTAWLAPAANDTFVAYELVPASLVSAAQSGPSLPASAWLFGAWLVIASMLGVRLVRNQLRTRALVRRARPLRAGELPVAVGVLRRSARVRRRVRFLVSTEVDTPAAGGLVRPFVMLPEGLAPRLDAAALRFVLLHELAHVRRRDAWIALAQRALQIALFFHPLVWWTNRLLDEQREFACDEAALRTSGARRRACGEGFLSVVEWARGRGARGAVGAVAMLGDHAAIRRRLMRILEEPARGGFGRAVCGAFALATVLLVLPAAPAAASASPQSARPGSNQDPERRDEVRRLQREVERLRAERKDLLDRLEALEDATPGQPAPEPSRRRMRAPSNAAPSLDAPDVGPEPAPEPSRRRMRAPRADAPSPFNAPDVAPVAPVAPGAPTPPTPPRARAVPVAPTPPAAPRARVYRMDVDHDVDVDDFGPPRARAFRVDVDRDRDADSDSSSGHGSARARAFVRRSSDDPNGAVEEVFEDEDGNGHARAWVRSYGSGSGDKSPKAKGGHAPGVRVLKRDADGSVLQLDDGRFIWGAEPSKNGAPGRFVFPKSKFDGAGGSAAQDPIDGPKAPAKARGDAERVYRRALRVPGNDATPEAKPRKATRA